MTGRLDKTARASSKRLIDKLGKALTVVREEQTYDPSTGQTTTTETTVSVNATPPKDYTTARIDGTLIEQGDTVIQIAAKGLDLGTPDAPQDTDKVDIDGNRWGIVQIGRVYSGDQIALYTLHLRK